MTDNFIERMEKEYEELSERCNKLWIFSDSDMFRNMPENKKTLIYTQLRAMKAYKIALRERIVLEHNERIR